MSAPQKTRQILEHRQTQRDPAARPRRARLCQGPIIAACSLNYTCHFQPAHALLNLDWVYTIILHVFLIVFLEAMVNWIVVSHSAHIIHFSSLFFKPQVCSLVIPFHRHYVPIYTTNLSILVILFISMSEISQTSETSHVTFKVSNLPKPKFKIFLSPFVHTPRVSRSLALETNIYIWASGTNEWSRKILQLNWLSIHIGEEQQPDWSREWRPDRAAFK